jgi:hypothetical protein
VDSVHNTEEQGGCSGLHNPSRQGSRPGQRERKQQAWHKGSVRAPLGALSAPHTRAFCDRLVICFEVGAESHCDPLLFRVPSRLLVTSVGKCGCNAGCEMTRLSVVSMRSGLSFVCGRKNVVHTSLSTSVLLPVTNCVVAAANFLD